MQQITSGWTHKEGIIGYVGFPKPKLEDSTKGPKRQHVAT